MSAWDRLAEIQDRAANDAEFCPTARTDVPALVSALLCVLDLHRPNQLGSLATCERCRDLRGSQIEYPCPTVRAVEAALKEGCHA